MAVGSERVATSPMAMSSCGRMLATATMGGQLNVWDTVSGQLLAQYVPTQHLSARCTTISWPSDSKTGPNTRVTTEIVQVDDDVPANIPVQSELQKLSVVAMGTATGAIFLFSVHRNEIHSVMTPSADLGHSAAITDVCWLVDNDSIFTSSKDKLVIEWSISKAKIKRKSLLDGSVPESLCVIDHQNLVTGSTLLKWWSWPDGQLLKTFTGHGTEVRCIRPIHFSNKTYLVSTGANDRYMHLWQLDQSSSTGSIASFLLDDEPSVLEVASLSISKPIFLVAVSKTGHLHLFEHRLTGGKFEPETSPISAKFHLEMQASCKQQPPSEALTNGKSGGARRKRKTTERSIPILYGHMDSSQVACNDPLVLLAYGNLNRPLFERMSFQDCERWCGSQQAKQAGESKNHGLVIKDAIVFKEMDGLPLPTLVNPLINHTKVKSALATDQTTVIGPAGMVPQQPLFNNINGGIANGHSSQDDDDPMPTSDSNDKNQHQKGSNKLLKIDSIVKQGHKETEADNIEPTLAERLQCMETESSSQNEQAVATGNTKKSKRAPRKSNLFLEDSYAVATESLVNVLIQGLQSKDAKMLEGTLKHPDETVVANTVKKLPTEYVSALLSELDKGLSAKNTADHQCYLRWLTLLLQHKVSYLMTIPNIDREFQSLNQLLQARTALLDKCYQLKGRLDLILTLAKGDLKTEKLTYQEPKLSYESETSSEEDQDEDEDGDDGLMSINDSQLLDYHSDEEDQEQMLVDDEEPSDDDDGYDEDEDKDDPDAEPQPDENIDPEESEEETVSRRTSKRRKISE